MWGGGSESRFWISLLLGWVRALSVARFLCHWLWGDFLGTSSHPPQEQEASESKEGDPVWGDLPATTPSPHPAAGPRALSGQRGERSPMTHRVCPTLSTRDARAWPVLEEWPWAPTSAL